MRQPTTAEVRLDQHKAASFGRGAGIREMSVYMPRLEKFLRRRNKPRLLESEVRGVG